MKKHVWVGLVFGAFLTGAVPALAQSVMDGPTREGRDHMRKLEAVSVLMGVKRYAMHACSMPVHQEKYDFLLKQNGIKPDELRQPHPSRLVYDSEQTLYK